MALTGGLAPNGKSALLAQKIWEEDINAKGGLLGRPVKLVYYDDQSSPAAVPAIYTKLLDVDKVDLIVGAYATAQIAPAMPIVIQQKKTFIGLLGLAVNTEFNYPNYFAMIPSGPDAEAGLHQGLLRRGHGAEPEAADGGDRRGRPGILAQRRRWRARECQGGEPARSSMTGPIRRRPPTLRRSCAPSRPPIPTSSSSAPIRRTPSAWCARSTRSASSRR